jgi:hypothetical protein
VARSRRWTIAKWFGLVVEVYLLFVFVNAALLIPYPYDRKRIALVFLVALLAAATGYGNGLVLFKLSKNKDVLWYRPLFAFPFITWGVIAIVVITAILGHLS